MQNIFFLFFIVITTSFSSFMSAATESKCVLVVGGAGFIGSHINEMLYRAGYQTIVLDNLSLGRRQAVQHGLFIEGDLADAALLDRVFSQHRIDAVMHFAAFKQVGESMKEPLKYYVNNVSNTLNLLAAMKRHQVKFFIFSSSAAVYGLPQEPLITEDHPCSPISPYGQSKLMVENILGDLDRTDQIRYCCLRYFNAAGGDPTGQIKNYEALDSNLIPIVLNSLQMGKTVMIFGNDYPTPDGTCIRDYIHIYDLGSAHITAMEKLFGGAPSNQYNLGTGQGYSVQQVISTIEKITGKRVDVQIGPRRLGDPAVLVASAQKAQRELNWEPRYSTLETMVEHAWNGMQK